MKFIKNRPKWVGEAVTSFHDSRRKKISYSEFIFGSVRGKKGDFVLVSNADAVDPDTPEGCDVAEIIELYETADDEDPYRAVVRWYSRPQDIPKRTVKFLQLDRKVEVILDERPFDNDVSIETFFSNCVVVPAKVDDDPVTEVKKLALHVSVPVFVCRYKLVVSSRLGKLEPYLDSDETDVNKSDFKSRFEEPMIDSTSASSVIKENKSYKQKFSKVDGSMKIHLNTIMRGVPSNLDAKASETMCGSTSNIVLKQLNLEMNRQAESVEDGDRSSSPTIPLTEPSMRWYRINDDSNDFTMVKVPIEVRHSSRKSVKKMGSKNTQPSVKNVNSKYTGDVTSESEDEIINIARLSRRVPLMHNKKTQMNNAKAGDYDNHGISKREVILEANSCTHKTKLKDTDISELLDVDANDDDDDDYSNNASHLPDKVTDKYSKPPSYRSSQLKISCEESESAVLRGMKTCEVNADDVPDKQTKGSNIQKCENKVKVNYIKPTSEISMLEGDPGLTSTLTSVKNAALKKQHKAQRTGNIGSCTKFNTDHGKSPFKNSDSVKSTRSISVLNTRHSDDKIAKLSKSQPCTSNSRLHHASAKKKLSYEYGETKQNISFGAHRSRSDISDTSLAFEDERIEGPETVRNGKAELHSTKLGCTSKHINDMKYIQKSNATACTFVSVKNSETTDQDLPRSIQDTTPRRPKRHILGGSANEDSDCEPGNMSRSKRYKSRDSADEGSDYELYSTSRCKQYKADELHTPKSPEADQKASPSLRSSSRRRKPNKLYGSDWSTSTTTPKHLLNRQVTVRTHGTPKTPKSEVTPHASITPVSKREDHWFSVMECEGDASGSSRLKLRRTNRYANCDFVREIQDTTPRRPKRHILGGSANEDSDCEPGNMSRSKRYKSRDSADEGSDYELYSTSRCKQYKADELHTPKSPEADQKASPSLRSSSRRRKPNKLYGSDWSTSTTTPKHLLNRQVTVRTHGTPKTPKSEITPHASITPVSKRGSSRHSVQTPSIPTRASSVSTPGSVLEEARVRLHVAAVPKFLPCREKEFDNICRFIEGKVHDGAGGCMYISGVPGTGKTATVQEVVRSLQDAVSQRNVPDFQFVELNGMWLTEPRQAYVHLLKALTGQAVTAEQAQQLLERRFSRAAPRRITTLVLIDELDLLWTRRQDVVYNLLDWPTKSASRLIVLAIANTMDLPERLLMGRVTSRLGLTRVTFHPYTHKQLQEIVMARLSGLQAFDPDAIQLVARKVAAVSGDARRALDICRRATELAEEDAENTDGIVTMQHVDQALGEMITSTKVQAIRCCSKMEQLFLQAVTAEIQRTGVEETVFEKVYVQLKAVCTFDGYTVPSVTDALGLCARLGSCRLLLTEHSRADIHQRVLLNVSSDEIYYALKVQ